MDASTKAVLIDAIRRVLPALEQFAGQFSESVLTWRKEGNSWHGGYEVRPSIRKAFAAARNELDAAALPFFEEFCAAHPEYKDKLVGCAGLGAQQLCKDSTYLLSYLLGTLWERRGTFAYDDAAVRDLVDGFEQFVDEPTLRLRFQAELLNFTSDESEIRLPSKLVVRRLSEDEVSTLNGGPVDMLKLQRSFTVGINEFVIEGECQEQKLIGDALNNADTSHRERTKALLDRAVLCLRTFKPGPVGYGWVRYKFIAVCPLYAPSIGYSDLYIPSGQYELPREDIARFVNHATRLFAVSEPAMETACRRLADAEVRVRSEDQIVDAVIGLEALLLAGLRNEDRRSELKYRFSIHYSTLFDDPQARYRSFRVAKNLYDLRSKIAHGSALGGGPVRLGDSNIPLFEAARKAREILRETINHFLSRNDTASYRSAAYWEQRYFGLKPVKSG